MVDEKKEVSKKSKKVESKPAKSSQALEKPKVQEKKEVKESKPKVSKSTKAKKTFENILVKSKRKMAVARATIKPGLGRVTINKVPYQLISNIYLRQMIEEPLVLANNFKDGLSSSVDILVNVRGGGQVSQIVASRSCIAKGILKFVQDDETLKEVFINYDRTLLIDDTRRKEAKKQLGRGARAKKQHSKR